MSWGLLFSALPLVAQDFRYTPVEWCETEDAPDTLPKLSGMDLPSVSRALRDLSEPAYAQFRTVVDEGSKVRTWAVHSTHPLVEAALDEVSSKMRRLEAARREGQPVSSEVRFFLIFNPRFRLRSSPLCSSPMPFG